MNRGVDLGAPRRRRSVGRPDVDHHAVDGGLGQQRHGQVPLGVAAQVLHDALRLRVVGVAEVRGEPVMGGQSNVVRSRDDDVGDHPALEARHPVSQHSGRDPAGRGQRFRDHRQRGRRSLIGGEAHEPPPGVRQHRAEQEQPRCSLGPVDDQILSR